MALSLVCHNKDCGALLVAETEDELVRLGQQHAQRHGHRPPPAAEHVLARIRKHNPQPAGDPRHGPPIIEERPKLPARSSSDDAAEGYTTQIASMRGFGRVEKIYIEGRWVGMVYRDPRPPAEVDELWMSYHQGGHAADSRQSAITQILEHAAANPHFEIRE